MTTLYEAVQEARDRAARLDSAVVPVVALDNILRDHTPPVHTILHEDGVEIPDWDTLFAESDSAVVITVAKGGIVSQYARTDNALDTIRLLSQVLKDDLTDLVEVERPFDERQRAIMLGHLQDLDDARAMFEGVIDGTYPRA